MSRISPSYVAGLEKYINELLNQVSTLKVELREICAAIDDPACDLTLTAVECIKKLKTENASLKRDAERYRWAKINPDRAASIFDCLGPSYFDSEFDKFMSQGEQK